MEKLYDLKAHVKPYKILFFMYGENSRLRKLIKTKMYSTVTTRDVVNCIVLVLWQKTRGYVCSRVTVGRFGRSIWVRPPEFVIKVADIVFLVNLVQIKAVRIKNISHTFFFLLELLSSNYVWWWTKIWSKSKRSPGDIISASVITRVAISRSTVLELSGDSVILYSVVATCERAL